MSSGRGSTPKKKKPSFFKDLTRKSGKFHLKLTREEPTAVALENERLTEHVEWQKQCADEELLEIIKKLNSRLCKDGLCEEIKDLYQDTLECASELRKMSINELLLNETYRALFSCLTDLHEEALRLEHISETPSRITTRFLLLYSPLVKSLHHQEKIVRVEERMNKKRKKKLEIKKALTSPGSGGLLGRVKRVIRNVFDTYSRSDSDEMGTIFTRKEFDPWNKVPKKHAQKKVKCRICESDVNLSGLKKHLTKCELQNKLCHRAERLFAKTRATLAKLVEDVEYMTPEPELFHDSGDDGEEENEGEEDSIELEIYNEVVNVLKKLFLMYLYSKSEVEDTNSENGPNNQDEFGNISGDTPTKKFGGFTFDSMESLRSEFAVLKSKMELNREKIPSWQALQRTRREIDLLLNALRDISVKVSTYSIRLDNAVAPKVSDFKVERAIARGGYATVFLARKKTTGDLFAMKVIQKKEMLFKNRNEEVIHERNIQIHASNPFSIYNWGEKNPYIVKVFYSFEGEKSAYICMEFCPGGDLFSLLEKKTVLEEEQAKQYIAELICALEFLHKRGVIHRDLKPGNILLDKYGHVKLSDFGLSEQGHLDMREESEIMKVITKIEQNSPNSKSKSPPRSARKMLLGLVSVSERDDDEDVDNVDDHDHDHGGSGMRMVKTYSEEFDTEAIANDRRVVRGSPDYLAPSLLLGKKHSFEVDFFALGVILFQCVFGVTPFRGENVNEVFNNILSGNIKWPNNLEIFQLSEDLIDLIQGLLKTNGKERLGSRNIEDIKNHRWFSDIRWRNVYKNRLVPEYVPNPSNESDVSLFAPRREYFEVDSQEFVHDEDMQPRRGSLHGLVESGSRHNSPNELGQQRQKQGDYGGNGGDEFSQILIFSSEDAVESEVCHVNYSALVELTKTLAKKQMELEEKE